MLNASLILQIKSAMKESLPAGRLHFAAHSHHPWPDKTRDAHLQYWLDSATHLDSKWNHIFGHVLPRSRSGVAELLGIKDPSQVIEGQNTFEFVTRLLSCFDFSKKIKILTTDSEFYSFERVSRRIAEFSNIQVDRIPTAPYETFEERFKKQLEKNEYHFVFSSLVFFNSGFYAEKLLETLQPFADKALIAIDLYHAYGAIPLKLERYAQSFFFLGGGYKYVSAGEGACFLTVPKGIGLRPWQTGWFADYGSLEKGVNEKIGYANSAARFAGATFDPTPWYRFNAVMNWWKELGLDPEAIHSHARGLQNQFASGLKKLSRPWSKAEILGQQTSADWANFLCLRMTNPQEIVTRLRQKDIFVDARADFIRFGFGYYQSPDDVDRLLKALTE